jgi:hypothetical protein
MSEVTANALTQIEETLLLKARKWLDAKPELNIKDQRVREAVTDKAVEMARLDIMDCKKIGNVIINEDQMQQLLRHEYLALHPVTELRREEGLLKMHSESIAKDLYVIFDRSPEQHLENMGKAMNYTDYLANIRNGRPAIYFSEAIADKFQLKEAGIKLGNVSGGENVTNVTKPAPSGADKNSKKTDRGGIA